MELNFRDQAREGWASSQDARKYKHILSAEVFYVTKVGWLVRKERSIKEKKRQKKK